MISVVVTIYNIEKYIEKCLESIVNQDYKNFEIVLVDDGSNDSSKEIALEFLKDKNIKYLLVEKENGGLSSARNAGLNNSNGDYVVFIDGDDYISKDFLLVLNRLIEENKTDFSFCSFSFIKRQDVFEVADANEVLFTRDELLSLFLKRTISFVVTSMLFKKSFLLNNNLFFNENTKFSEDQMFIWNVIFASERSAYSFRKMYGYCIRENSIMTSSSYEKVENSLNDYVFFTNDLIKLHPEYTDIINKILPRWQLGALYTSASLLNRDDFLRLYEKMDGKTILRRLRGIKENKAYLLAFVSMVSGRLLYALCRRMNLNE